MTKKRFFIGKYYKHSGGRMLHILGAVETTIWSMCFVAEEAPLGVLVPIGMDAEASTGWEEMTKEEWLLNFNGR